DPYRNGRALPVELSFPEGYEPEARRQPVEILLDPGAYARFYEADPPARSRYPGTLVRTEEGRLLRFDAGASLPEPLATIATVSRSNDDELQGALVEFAEPPAGPGVPGVLPAPRPASVRFAPVRFVKLTAISGAALEFAETAASLALGLIGVLALFLGMLKIAEAS